MAVQTANTLFRFTGKLDYLLHVLSQGFSPRLSLEVNYNGEKRYYPMVCFCDIPLSMVDRHMEKFGTYGLGMTKQWGERNGLNPVLYYNRESTLIKMFFNLLHQSIMNTQELFRLGVDGEWLHDGTGVSRLHYDHNPRNEKIREAFWPPIFTSMAIKDLERFFKPQMGEYEINGQHYSNYSFYDEREWRYLPFERDFQVGFKSPVEYIPTKFDEAHNAASSITNEEKEKINRDIEHEGKYTLHFNCEDIKYIIVETEDEIIKVVNHLKSLKNKTGDGPLYTQDQIMLLTSRILTCSQINQDF